MPDNKNTNISLALDYIQAGTKTPTPSGNTNVSVDGVDIALTSSGDGLYEYTYTDGRYVYRGANPNNYITLGSDTYRIISVETDGTLKIIKNDSIGDIAFDKSINRPSSVSTDYCYDTYGCNVWGSNATMLDSSGNHITTMPRYVGETTTYDLPDSEASMNIYLNNDWYNSLDSSIRNKITTHTYSWDCEK